MSRLSASSRIHYLIVTARRPLLQALVLVALTGAGFAETPLTTAFTYQGRLLEDGLPVTDTTDGRDFLFKLYDVTSEGTPLASYYGSGAQNVPVANGLFAATIDFGTPVFTGSKRYLEVWIRDGFITGDENNESTYSVAGDRQELTAAPNAIFAMTADKATSATSLRSPDGTPATAVHVADDGKVGVGTTSPTATLEVSGTTKLAGATTITGTTTIGSSGNALVKLGNVEMDNSQSAFLRTFCSSGDTGGIHMGYDEPSSIVGLHYGGDDAQIGYVQSTNQFYTAISGGIVKSGFNTGDPTGIVHIVGQTADQLRLGQLYNSPSGGTVRVSDLTTTSDKGVSLSIAANGKFDSLGILFPMEDTTSDPQSVWVTGMRTDRVTSMISGGDGDQFSISRRPPGVGTSLYNKLVVTANGALHLYGNTTGDANSPPLALDSNAAALYVGCVPSTSIPDNIRGELYARPGDNSAATRLTSHADPAMVDSAASSSFSNPQVPMPFSFAHTSELLGKGCIVDTAKVMKWAEEKMQQEQGSEEGKVFYYYDLPEGSRASYDQYIRDRVTDAIRRKLEATPLVEVGIATDGTIPSDSWEEVETTELREIEESFEADEIDWATSKIVKVPHTRKVMKQVGTGVYKRQLKANYSLQNGKLYREATPDDVDIEASDVQLAPDWVLDRMPDAPILSVDQIIEQELSKARVSYREIQTAQSSEAQAEPKSKGGN